MSRLHGRTAGRLNDWSAERLVGCTAVSYAALVSFASTVLTGAKSLRRRECLRPLYGRFRYPLRELFVFRVRNAPFVQPWIRIEFTRGRKRCQLPRRMGRGSDSSRAWSSIRVASRTMPWCATVRGRGWLMVAAHRHVGFPEISRYSGRDRVPGSRKVAWRVPSGRKVAWRVPRSREVAGRVPRIRKCRARTTESQGALRVHGDARCLVPAYTCYAGRNLPYD